MIALFGMVSALGLAACDNQSPAAQKDATNLSSATNVASAVDAKTAIRAAIAARNFGEAARQAQMLTASTPQDPEGWLLLARAEALGDNQGAALDALDHAVLAGLANAEGALNDPAFDAMRDTDRFAAIVQRAIPTARPPVTRASAIAAPAHTGRAAVELGKDSIRAGDVVIEGDL